MAKRRRFAPNVTARVALEALWKDRMVRQIASGHGVHPNQFSQRKGKAREELTGVIERGAKRRR